MLYRPLGIVVDLRYRVTSWQRKIYADHQYAWNLLRSHEIYPRNISQEAKIPSSQKYPLTRFCNWEEHTKTSQKGCSVFGIVLIHFYSKRVNRWSGVRVPTKPSSSSPLWERPHCIFLMMHVLNKLDMVMLPGICTDTLFPSKRNTPGVMEARLFTWKIIA